MQIRFEEEKMNLLQNSLNEGEEIVEDVRYVLPSFQYFEHFLFNCQRLKLSLGPNPSALAFNLTKYQTMESVDYLFHK